MIQCENHPASPAVVTLDWQEDYVDLCSDCIAPEVRRLSETLVDMFLGEPVITIRLTDDR